MMRTTPIAAQRASRGPGPRRSFTLTELLVAMGIIAIIGGITAIGIRTVAKDARKSSATNTIVAALDNARALAIRENTLVVVVFRARLDTRNRQFVEIVTARWTGESPTIWIDNASSPQVVDRFVPAPGVASRRLPVGIKVAGPRYHGNLDFEWMTQTHLPTQPEARGRVIGVLYSLDGTVVARNSASDSSRFFVDFNSDGKQQISGCWDCPNNEIDYLDPPVLPDDGTFSLFMMLQQEVDDEPLVTVVPYLAVYDDDAARAEGEPSSWNDFDNYFRDLIGPGDPSANPPVPPGFITRNADRLHFNRYTGVVMR